MKAYAFDSESAAALFKLGSSVAFAHRSKIREKRAARWPGPKKCFNLLAEADKREIARLFSRIADDLAVPINVIGLEKGDVRLRGSDVPGEFICDTIALTFLIELSLNTSRRAPRVNSS